eukprot:scaffold74286_cov62-Attheya_sp.AAC.1
MSSDLSTYTDAAKEMTDSIQAFEEAGADPTAIAKFSKTIARLETFSAAFGLVGAGLGVIALFENTKSDTDIILDAISALSEQITGLKSQLDNILNVLELDILTAQLQTHLFLIEDVRQKMDTYKVHLSERNYSKAVTLLSHIKKDYKRNKIQNAVQGITEIVSGLANISTGYFQKLVESTHGQYSEVQRLGLAILPYIQQAIIFDGLLVSLNVEKNAVEDELAYNNDQYDGYCQKFLKAFLGALQNCTKKELVAENIEAYMKTEVIPNIPAGHYEKKAQYILDKVTVRWAWLDFIAISYTGVSGFKNHDCNSPPHYAFCAFRAGPGHHNYWLNWIEKDEKINKSALNTEVKGYKYTEEDYHYNAEYPINIPEVYNGKAESCPFKSCEDIPKFLVSKRTGKGMVWALRKKAGSASYKTTNEDRVKWATPKKFYVARFN